MNKVYELITITSTAVRVVGSDTAILSDTEVIAKHEDNKKYSQKLLATMYESNQLPSLKLVNYIQSQ